MTTTLQAALVVLALGGTACLPDSVTHHPSEPEVTHADPATGNELDTARAQEPNESSARESLKEILRKAPPAPMPYEEPPRSDETEKDARGTGASETMAGYDPETGNGDPVPMGLYEAALTPVNDELRLEVDILAAELIEALRDTDTDQLLRLLSDDVTLLPDVGPPWHGKDALRRQQPLAGLRVHALSRTPVKLSMSGRQLIELGTFSIEYEQHSSREQRNSSGKYLVVYKRQRDGSLAVAIGIWNSDRSSS